ncbi:MAG: T9SS type A sorting domain-containing protein [Bacteroidota bacterium]
MHLSSILLTSLFSLGFIFLLAQNRNCDPVVLTGQEADCILGEMPDDIVAFKYYQSLGWSQIPIQIDERVLLDIVQPFDSLELENARDQGSECLRGSTMDIEWNVLFYADAETHTGADTSLVFDEDDELVFMPTDLGEQSQALDYPNGTIDGSICEIAVTEPLENDLILGYIYLFRQDGSLAQDAGVDYVDYYFTYENTANYLADYKECTGNGLVVNAENSVISTANYELGFTNKWLEDTLKIKAGNATATDILDRHQLFINAGSCNSTEDGFSDNQGAHVAATDGPIRAIRSVIGASSGIFTQLNILATACRAVYEVSFRLHPANGFNDVLDMNTYALNKLTYYSQRNLDDYPNGVAVDGVGEALNNLDPDEWSMYEGTPGSLIISWDYDTDMTVDTVGLRYNNGNGPAECDVRAYYDDKGNSASHPCTGDGLAHGSSGFSLRTKRCTDRRYNWSQYTECLPDSVKFFSINRVHYYKAPGMTVDSAIQYDLYAKHDLGHVVMDGVGIQPATCPENRSFLNQNITVDSIYYAADTISTQQSVSIQSGTAVTFSAGAAVLLKAGFTAANGSTFTARIGGCIANPAQHTEARSRTQTLANTLSIYPNPSDGQVNISYHLPQDSPIHLGIYHLNGQLLKVAKTTSTEQKGKHLLVLDTADLTPGIYIVLLRSKFGVVSRKLSVVR